MDGADRMTDRAMRLAERVDLEGRLARFQIDGSTQTNLRQLKVLKERHRISGIPVVEAGGAGPGKLIGIITNRDMRFEVDLKRPVADVMTTVPLITAQEGVSADAALNLLRRHKIEKLPIVDGSGRLTGLITVKDFVKTEQHPLATKDADGRLLVGAAVGADAEDLDGVADVAEVMGRSDFRRPGLYLVGADLNGTAAHPANQMMVMCGRTVPVAHLARTVPQNVDDAGVGESLQVAVHRGQSDGFAVGDEFVVGVDAEGDPSGVTGQQDHEAEDQQ